MEAARQEDARRPIWTGWPPKGCVFTNYYGQASCTAGRASFITGRIPIRTALSTVLGAGNLNGLKREDPTIAEALKALGYQTVQWGKMALGR